VSKGVEVFVVKNAAKSTKRYYFDWVH
jgi:hypothetical protein